MWQNYEMEDHHVELLSGLRDNFNKVRRLLEESKKDSEDDPYRSKYAAREILNDVKSSLVKLLDDIGDGESSGIYVTITVVFVPLFCWHEI
ncbi:hypothetical protein J437_LFUL001002 [Ladona fulva]|uniref:Uncharacterized protein n=1 Tax=Ladona fulva TaxID=123851 RepID=A0A8K0KGI9_LADFU|nr:hypothetical protein J437_LFUL001002 [Ladona fulva]